MPQGIADRREHFEHVAEARDVEDLGDYRLQRGHGDAAAAGAQAFAATIRTRKPMLLT